jgi:hypothetical protein
VVETHLHGLEGRRLSISLPAYLFARLDALAEELELVRLRLHLLVLELLNPYYIWCDPMY